MAAKGIDIRATSGEVLLRAFLQDSAGAKVTTGTASLRLYELQMSDGALRSYDFADHTFKTTALTTETASMTHRPGNNGTTPTGLWTYRLATLTGFTVGTIYFAAVAHSGASPPDQVREFQFGGAEGDLLTESTYLQVDVEHWRTAVPNALVASRVDASVGGMGSNTLTAAALAPDALTEIQSVILSDATPFPGAFIDAVLSSRLASASYVVPDNAGITAIQAKTDALPAEPAAVGAAMTLTPGERDAVTDTVWEEVVDGTTTARQSLRLHNAVLGGKLSGGGTSTETMRDLADTKDRVVANVDESGNRTTITRDLS